MYKVEITYPYNDNTEVGEYDTLEEAQKVAVEEDKELFRQVQIEPPTDIESDFDVEMYMDGAPYVSILNFWDDSELGEYDHETFDPQTDLRSFIESLLPDDDE